MSSITFDKNKLSRAKQVQLVHARRLIIIKLQLESPVWVTFCWCHGKSPTETSHPHKHAYISLSHLYNSHYIHDLITGTDVFYGRVMPLRRFMMNCGFNGRNKNFTSAPLWWMQRCHGNTMVKLPAVPPTLTAHLRILKSQLSLCSL